MRYTFVCMYCNLLSITDVTTEPLAEDSGSSQEEIYPQSLIAVGVLAGAILIGMGVAKLVDVIHDRQSLRDDASDMSEYTRKLLRARVTISAFKSAVEKDKEKQPINPEESARKLLRVWSARTNLRGKRKDLTKTDGSGNDGDVAKPDAELKGYKPKGDDRVFAISLVAMETGGASTAALAPTSRDKSLLPQLTVISEISEQKDSEAMAEKVEEKEKKSRENSKASENKKEVDEQPKSRKASIATLAQKDPDPLQSSYIGYRGDSDDLMIPVSTDEPPRAKTPVTGLAQKEDSNDDYDFLNNTGNSGDDTARENTSQSTNRSASQITLQRMDTRSSAASEKSHTADLAGVHGANKPSRPGTSKGLVPLSRGASQAVIPTQSPGRSRPPSAATRPRTPGTPRKISSVSPGPDTNRPKTPIRIGERGKSNTTITPGVKKSASTISNTKL